MVPAFKAAILILIPVIAITACAHVGDACKGEDMTTPKSVEAVLAANTEELLQVPGVVGTAQSLCNSNPCIKVYVVRKTPELEREIPDRLEGYPVIIEETGEIGALPNDGK